MWLIGLLEVGLRKYANLSGIVPLSSNTIDGLVLEVVPFER